MIRNQRAANAFTLVELLVASAITIVLVVLLSRVIVAALDIYRTSDQRMDAFRDAKAAMQMMTSDLSKANTNGNAQMLTLASYGGTNNEYAKEVYAVYPAKNRGKSDLSTAAYYLDWDDNARAFSLRRFFKDSDTTFISLAQSPANYTTLFDRTKSTTPETIASYVWGFEVRPGQGATTVLPTAAPSNQWSWVEIRFKAMSVKAGRKLRSAGVTKTTWDDPSSSEYQRLILPEEQQFVTRVSLLQNQ